MAAPIQPQPAPAQPDIATKEGLTSFLRSAAGGGNAPSVHMDAARAERIRAALQAARLDPDVMAVWNQRTAAAFADEVGRGELCQAMADENGGKFPVDERSWPIINVQGRLISLDPHHDCHTTGKAPRAAR